MRILTGIGSADEEVNLRQVENLQCGVDLQGMLEG